MMKDWGWLVIVALIVLALRQQGVATNEEVWEWTDFRGVPRKVTVHRASTG